MYTGKFKEGDRVTVISECQSRGCTGTVTGGYWGGLDCGMFYITVTLDDGRERHYREDSLKRIKDVEDKMALTGFNDVAIVNLVEDYYKKDYGFALYMDEHTARNINPGKMVVVNAGGKDRRVVGIVKELVPFASYKGKTITAQVIGVVNTDGFDAREAEEKRLAEIAKQRGKIEKELKAEIEKLQTAELYEMMAARHPENTKLVELVAGLKALEM